MQQDFIFLAWLAGFVDGEGCVSLNRQRNKAGNPAYSPALTIVQTDRAILEHIAATLCEGGVYTCPAVPVNGYAPRAKYQYVVNGRGALRVVAALLPYLRLKRAQAEALLEYEALPHGAGAGRPASEQAAIYAALRAPQEALYLRLRALKRGPGEAARPSQRRHRATDNTG